MILAEWISNVAIVNIYSTLDIHDLSKSDRVLDQIEYKYLNLNWISIPIISHYGVACYLDKADLNFDHYLHLLVQ